MENSPVHKGNTSKTEGTTPFGVRVPDLLLHEFEATRLRHRPDLHTRQDAIIDAMREWMQAQERRAAA